MVVAETGPTGAQGFQARYRLDIGSFQAFERLAGIAAGFVLGRGIGGLGGDQRRPGRIFYENADWWPGVWP